MRLWAGSRIVIASFTVSGAVHLLRPQVFEPIVPRMLPWRRELVYVSGVAELVCASGMVTPRTSRYAAWASAALLVAVFPANVQMAVDAHRVISHSGSTPARQVARAFAIARLPMQVPLVVWALQGRR